MRWCSWRRRRIGAIWVGLNPVQQLDEYRYILSDTQPALIFAFERLRERDNHQILLTLKSEYPCARPSFCSTDPMEGFLSYEAFIALGRGVSDRELPAGVASVLPGDAALIVYTSGSTGTPKGAVLTQLNIAHWTKLYRGLWPRTPLTVICNLPVTHIGCCVETLAFALAAGGTIVFQEHFDAAGFLALIEREQGYLDAAGGRPCSSESLPDWET